MAVKHRKQRGRIKKIATLSAATATVTALTAGVAPAAVANAAAVHQEVVLTAAVGPNYTDDITSASNSLNNLLFAAANFENSAGSFWNPIASAVPGGLLPTFGASVHQNNLATLVGVLGALTDLLTLPNTAGIPGLSDALFPGLGGLAPGVDLSGLTARLAAVLSALSPVAATLDGVLGDLHNGLDILPGVSVSFDDLPSSLEELIPGLILSQTLFQSHFDWPVLGAGGDTSINNLFAQLPTLSLGDLVAGVVDGLVPTVHVGGIEVPLDAIYKAALQSTVAGLLSPLNAIETPSVTAWVPGGSGNYALPLGGSAGWLAAMPTVDLGVLRVDGNPVPPFNEADTVLAIPLFAGGIAMPLNLATYGLVTTPGLVLPTATGVDALGGTTLQTFNIPSVNLGYTSLNTLQMAYVGTNGINFSSGQTLLTLNAFGLPIPIVYSMGSFNVGTTGFGVTLPSLFTVGLAPSFQVGTAPMQTYPDGLIPKEVLNLPFQVPTTQTTNIASLLGLPDVGKQLSDSVLTPLFNSVAAPIGTQFTNYLDANWGTWADQIAKNTEQFTGQLKDFSEGLPGATDGVTTLNAPDTGARTLSIKTTAEKTTTDQKSTPANNLKTALDGVKLRSEQNQAKFKANAEEARQEIDKSFKEANARVKASVEKARAQAEKSVKDAQTKVNGIAENGRKQIEAAAKGANVNSDKAVPQSKTQDTPKKTFTPKKKEHKRPSFHNKHKAA